MRNKKLIEKTLNLLGLASRQELEHIVSCHDCDLLDMDGPYVCQAFRTLYYQEIKREPGTGMAMLPPEIQELWSKEILKQAMPSLKFDQFAQKQDTSPWDLYLHPVLHTFAYGLKAPEIQDGDNIIRGTN